MNIVLISPQKFPAFKYGGTERVVFNLAKELVKFGHSVTLCGPVGSTCDFTKVITFKDINNVETYIPDAAQIVHFNSIVPKKIKKPYLVTVHGNAKFGENLDKQSVFISRNHAYRYGGEHFVYNGLCSIDFYTGTKRTNFHFLGKAAWRRKNVRGAIRCAKKADRTRIDILGGSRLNFNMGFRFTPDLHACFHGMVDNDYKNKIMSKSRGLVFPVQWNEPFGLAITESLSAGCPVFGSPYGSLPELVPDEVGFLSTNSDDLAEAMKDSDQWKPKVCRDYAIENFNSKKMALKYLEIYERVLAGEILNKSAPTLQEQEPKLLPFE